MTTDVQALRKMPYSEYLRTAWWKKMRKWVLIFWKGRCAICNSNDMVEVHHRTYERRGQELITDCIVLCRMCHETVHVFAKAW